MRHNKNFNHLGRQAGHRKAMLSNMASSLILHKRIETTVAKAKAVKQFVEPLVTKSKEDTTHSRRIVFSYLKQKEAVTELFRTIAPKIADRPGGYTRILKTGFRLGDAADMCIIEFVDFNEAYTLGILPTAAEAKPKTRRSRGKKAADAAAEAAPATEGGEEKKAAKPAAKKAAAAKPAASKAAAGAKKVAAPPSNSSAASDVYKRQDLNSYFRIVRKIRGGIDLFAGRFRYDFPYSGLLVKIAHKTVARILCFS